MSTKSAESANRFGWIFVEPLPLTAIIYHGDNSKKTLFASIGNRAITVARARQHTHTYTRKIRAYRGRSQTRNLCPTEKPLVIVAR